MTGWRGTRTVLRTVLGWLSVALLVAVAFYGGRTSVETVPNASRTTTAVGARDLVWEVKQESIGRTLTFVSEISATTAPGPLANEDGVLTDVPIGQGASVGVDGKLLEVDLRPIVAGQGTVPAFRDLQEGDTGADVAQLRRFLGASGHGAGRGDPSQFTPAVTLAVNAWHKSRGVAPDGRVRMADIMWFPELPVEVRPGKDVATGQRLTASDRPLLAVSGAPRMAVRVTRAQGALVPPGSIARFGAQTQGVVRSVASAPAGAAGTEATQDSVNLEVTTPDGAGNICAASDECRSLLAGGATVAANLAVEVVPKQEGAGVPVRAILTRPDDTTYVVRTSGAKVPVSVTGTSGGVALVEGLKVGDKIRMTSDDHG